MNTTIFIYIFLTVGFYLLLCAAAKLPLMAYRKTMLQVVSDNQSKGNLLKITEMNLALRLSKLIKLSEYRKKTMSDSLRSAGIPFTPELHLAQIIARFLMRSLLALPAASINPIVSIMVIVWAVYTMFGEFKSTDKIIRQKRDRIESDLPRLTAMISQKIKASKDVIGILDSFLPSAGVELREQLQITLAEMRTGSPDRALSKLELRVGSTMMREVVLGLQSVLHGDDINAYFERLEHDLSQAEIQKLKLNNMQRPGKVRLYTTLALGWFILTAFGILGIYAYVKAKALI
ncbi:secretion protein F [Faecalispora anaeroviscerum]|uniref:secretion protein F n=1 Tax=Faecalispora anaeroviscerum TaxID=2991836 RepID=UPI0024BA1EF4|nr:secretion protein F [Faecalispora anaeroviscerum]